MAETVKDLVVRVRAEYAGQSQAFTQAGRGVVAATGSNAGANAPSALSRAIKDVNQATTAERTKEATHVRSVAAARVKAERDAAAIREQSLARTMQFIDRSKYGGKGNATASGTAGNPMEEWSKATAVIGAVGSAIALAAHLPQLIRGVAADLQGGKVGRAEGFGHGFMQWNRGNFADIAMGITNAGRGDLKPHQERVQAELRRQLVENGSIDPKKANENVRQQELNIAQGIYNGLLEKQGALLQNTSTKFGLYAEMIKKAGQFEKDAIAREMNNRQAINEQKDSITARLGTMSPAEQQGVLQIAKKLSSGGQLTKEQSDYATSNRDLFGSLVNDKIMANGRKSGVGQELFKIAGFDDQQEQIDKRIMDYRKNQKGKEMDVRVDIANVDTTFNVNMNLDAFLEKVKKELELNNIKVLKQAEKQMKDQMFKVLNTVDANAPKIQ